MEVDRRETGLLKDPSYKECVLLLQSRTNVSCHFNSEGSSRRFHLIRFSGIHRSNLVGMGIVPLQYLEGQNAESIGLTGQETFDILLPENVHPHEKINVLASSGIKFQVIVRFDTDVDVTYFKNGGILNYMIRKMIE